MVSGAQSDVGGGGGLLLNSRQVRSRLGEISPMALWRWRNDPGLHFPLPTIIKKRNYWRSGELASWVDDQARTAATIPDETVSP